MERFGMITIALVAVNFFVSYRGINNSSFFRRYRLDVRQVLVDKDYIRLLSCGFLHSGWFHFIFNMAALYSFGSRLELDGGIMELLIVYFSALLASSALSVFIHRHKTSYTSVGASGAICGIVYAAITLYPDMQLGLLFIPNVHISAWIFGMIYMLYCMLGMRSQRGNVAHDAHLTGGLTGILTTVTLFPYVLQYNLFTIAAIAVPTLVFLYFVITKRGFLILSQPFTRQQEGALTIDDQYNASKKFKEMELDHLLDKIGRHGINSLSKKEKERLEELSKVK
jgi:membrane associated rhomboid family serine protease